MGLKTKDKIKSKKNKKVQVKKILSKNEEKSDNEESSDEEMDTVDDDPIQSNEKVMESIDNEENSNSETEETAKSEDPEGAIEKTEQDDKKMYDKEDEARTVFCGNIPNDPNVTKGRIKDLFAQYGSLKSIRLRTENGSVIFSKKVKKLCKNFNAYVVFQNEEDAKKALQLNGHKLIENPLRVNMANNKQQFTNKGTIFVGNLPFDATEAEVHDFFNQVGDIEYVRKLPKKGIAFVCFKKGVSLINALKLNDQEFKGRKLRVSRSESKEKQERKKMFKKDPKTGKIIRQKVKKSQKLNDKLVKGRPNINNPIVKKIKDTQKSKFKNTDSDVPKKELFRRGGKMDKDNREFRREKRDKKQKFFGSKVDDPNSTKIKKGKISKTAKEQKVFAKKLKSAAQRLKS